MKQTAFIITLLIMTGCSSPSLYVDDQHTIGIVADQKSIGVEARPLLQDRVTLDRIYVTRTLYGLEDRGQPVVYEDIRLQAPNQFQYDMPRTLGILFDTLKYRMIDRVGNLSFFILTLKDGRTVLAIVQNINKQGMRLMYGLNAKQLNAALKHAGSNAAVPAGLNGVTLPADKTAFLINWNPKMTMLDGLIRRPGGRPMGQ